MGTRTPVLALALVYAAACAGKGGDAGWAGTVTDSAGIQIINNPEAGIWASGEAPTVTEELNIGTAGDDPDYEFGMIAAIDVGSDGTIYVLDQQAGQVRAFDSAGKYIRTIGKPGSGPGELSRFATAVVVTPGDSLMVADMGLQRVTRYGPDGSVIGSFPTPLTEGLSVRWQARGDGDVVQQARIMALPGQAAQAKPVEPKDLLLVRNAQGALIDTLMQLPAGKTLQMGSNSMRIRLFEAEPVWSLGDDGSVYFAMNSDYSIEVHDAQGALHRIIRRPFERKPVTDGDKQAFLKMLREMFSRQAQTRSLPPQAIEQIINSVEFAANYPAFAILMGGPAGTLWVQRVRTAADVKAGEEFNIQDTGAPDWDIYGKDGRYLGVITLPAKFQPLRVVGDEIYGVQRDELDVQHVSRLRVDMGSNGMPTSG